MNKRYEDIFLIDIVATIVGIIGVIAGISSLGTPTGWLILIVSLTVGLSLYLAGQGIIARREQIARVNEQLKELKEIKELLQQSK